MPDGARRLTSKGLATRTRIVEAAAGLIYTHGVHGTNNEVLRDAAGVSGSQLSHYFPEKEDLVRAVLTWRVDSMLGLHEKPPRGRLDSMGSMRDWAASYLAPGKPWAGGCSFGSLVGEIVKSGLDLDKEIHAGFARFEDSFIAGLQAMREEGTLAASAEPRRLAHALMAAFQGGMLISAATGDPAPLRDALDAALDYVETFAN